MYKKLSEQILSTENGGSKKVRTDCILKIKDKAGNNIVHGMYIPFDEANTDYQEYLEWVAEGNTAEAAD